MAKQKITYAGMSRRAAAFFLDAIIAVVLGLLLYVFVGNYLILPATGYSQARKEQVQMGIDAGLYYSSDGLTPYYIEAESYLDYENATYNYYAVWLPDQVAHEGEEGYYPIDAISSDSEVTSYGVDYYNRVVLGLSDTSDSSGSYGNTYYTWDVDEEGNIDSTVRAVLKTTVSTSSEDLESYWLSSSSTGVYADACSHLASQSYFEARQSIINTAVYYASIPAILGPILLMYLFFPLVLPHGKTLGKLVMRISLLTKEGYYLPRYRIALRQLPLIIILCLLLVPVYSTYFMIGMMALLLGDFFSSGSGNQYMCLHDRLAGSIAVDGRVTHYFKDAEEEAKYYEENPLEDEVPFAPKTKSEPSVRPGAYKAVESMYKDDYPDEEEVVEEATSEESNEEAETNENEASSTIVENEESNVSASIDGVESEEIDELNELDKPND